LGVETIKTVYKVLIGIGVVIIAVFSGLFALGIYLEGTGYTATTSNTPQKASVDKNTVIVAVHYIGDWSGAIGDQTGVSTWNGHYDYVSTGGGFDSNTGTFTPHTWAWVGSPDTNQTLTRNGGVWVVSANAQKQDDSSATLTITIEYADGTVIKEASTNSPYGIAQVTATIP
jgi:hypothetical protein